MLIKRGIGAAGLGAVALGCLGVLAHCGGGSSGPGSSNDSGPSEQDATVPDAPNGMDGTEPSGDGSPQKPDTGSDSGGGSDAQGSTDGAPDGVAPVDAGSDAKSAEGGLDAGPDAIAEAAAPGPACDAQAACMTDASTVQCCSGYCIDTAKDPANCGQCGRACTSTQFCTGTACDDTIIANVCANPNGTVALDPYGVDNDAGIAMGNALVGKCVPAPTIVQKLQHDPSVTDISGSGRPVTGPGNTFITGGGGYGQIGVAYMETSITPLYITDDGTHEGIVARSNPSTPVVSVLLSSLGPGFDYFYVQVSVEPRSGSLCFSSAGMQSPGTVAAGYYVSQVMIPNIASYTKSWYVYQWVDNGDQIPNAADTFTPVMSGP
jgi:hypothetical protein